MSLLLVLVVAQPDAGADAGVRDGGVPPAALACLTTWYAGRVEWKEDAGWGLELPTGAFVPWVTGAEVFGPESEEAPDLEDLFHTPYQAGPIVPVDTSDAGPPDDPGRVRVVELFMATYGSTRSEVSSRLAKVKFFGLRYPFHELAAPALTRVVARLEPQVKANPSLLPFLKNIGGTWSWRKIARSKSLSAHAFGIAIDINVERSHYWRWKRRGEPLVWKNQIPQAIVDAFEAEGFIWGGRWQHFDTMHFEYRPELLSPACRGP
ncbi:MAG: M15 family metallopeptidase [Myxococcota bacterium]